MKIKKQLKITKITIIANIIETPSRRSGTENPPLKGISENENEK